MQVERIAKNAKVTHRIAELEASYDEEYRKLKVLEVEYDELSARLLEISSRTELDEVNGRLSIISSEVFQIMTKMCDLNESILGEMSPLLRGCFRLWRKIGELRRGRDDLG